MVIKTKKMFLGVVLLLCVVGIPEAIFAQTTQTPPPQSTVPRGFLREGIFGCSSGGVAYDVAVLRAIQGVYVPVNDAAVTQNTGYLVFKECVLDGMALRMGEAAGGALTRSILTWVNKGDNGEPQFVTNETVYRLEVGDRTALEALKKYNFSNACTAYQEPIRKQLAQEYLRRTREPGRSYACTAKDQKKLEACLNGDLINGCGGIQGFLELMEDPGNFPQTAYENAKKRFEGIVASEIEDAERQVDRGQGFKPTYETRRSPTGTGEDREERYILTPGNIVMNAINQAAGSGFRRLENADEIDEIVNALFSGLSTQILTDVRGLRGVSETRLGRAPYLDQLSAEASGGVRNAAANTALTILNSSLATEEAFNRAKRATKAALEQAIAQLRRAEDRCWEILIPKVQQYAIDAACTNISVPGQQGQQQTQRVCTAPLQLRISTSTQMITGGVVALSISTGATVQSGSNYTLPFTAGNVALSGSVQLTANATQTYASSTNVGVPLGTATNPVRGGSASIPLNTQTPFSGGTVQFALQPTVSLPVGETRFILNVTTPFTQGVVSVIVAVAQQFADAIINAQIKPVLEVAIKDIDDSNKGLAQLVAIANDIRNTTSVTAQRIALEKLDTLIAQRLVHTAYDVKAADQQSEVTASSMKTLIEDTVKEWGTGNGWCNAENPDVLRMWYDRWKVTN